jgi:serine/threonine protein kinase
VKQIYVEKEDKRKQMQHELSLLHTFRTKPLLKECGSEAMDDDMIGDHQADLCTEPAPYVVQLHDAYTDPDERSVSLVLEYMSGGALDAFVKQVRTVRESAFI